MKTSLNIIPDNPDLVIIALNPTQEAIRNGGLFSRDKSLWNFLIRAGIIRDSINDINLKIRAKEVCSGLHTHLSIGIADLLPSVIESISKNVQVNKGAATDLFREHPGLKNSKKIVLLGQKVVDGFSLDFPNLKKWRDLPKIEGKKAFGEAQEIEIAGSKVKIFTLPFPNGNNIPNKHELYRKVLDD